MPRQGKPGWLAGYSAADRYSVFRLLAVAVGGRRRCRVGAHGGGALDYCPDIGSCFGGVDDRQGEAADVGATGVIGRRGAWLLIKDPLGPVGGLLQPTRLRYAQCPRELGERRDQFDAGGGGYRCVVF